MRFTLPPPVSVAVALVASFVVDAVYLIGVLFEEVRHVEEAVAFETHVNERRLHSGQYSRDSPLVDTAGQRILVGPLKIHLNQLPVFENRDFRLVTVLADHQFLGRHE